MKIEIDALDEYTGRQEVDMGVSYPGLVTKI